MDLAGHPEVAARYGVLTTPAVVVAGELVFVGRPRRDGLLARIRAAGRA